MKKIQQHILTEGSQTVWLYEGRVILGRETVDLLRHLRADSLYVEVMAWA